MLATVPWVAEPKTRTEPKKKYEKYRKFFPGTPLDIIKKTFKATTQMGRIGAIPGYNLKHRLKSPNPALSIPRRNEPVATDTVYGPKGVPAVDDGSTVAQFFIGRKSVYRSIRPCGHSDAQFVKVLHDEIREYGAMNQLISNRAKAESSEIRGSQQEPTIL